MAIDESSFAEFINQSGFSKEVPLIIAEDERELHQFRQLLNKAGHDEQESVYHLIHAAHKGSKNYLVLDDHHPFTLKQAYDFVVQYPTGQIEVSDQVTMQKAIFSPKYEENHTLLLVTRRELAEIEKTGLTFLSRVGATYQNA
ncbi:MAG: hypothetical protein AAB669_03790 [Patescibacteria group bacterium]